VGENPVFTGSGTVLKTGTNTLLTGTSTGKVKWAMTGGLIDVRGGILLNDYMDQTLSWNSNKASMNIASGATVRMVGGNVMFVDALTGAGTIDDNNSWGIGVFTLGVNNASGTFSGLINDNGGKVAITKNGTGTQTLSGPLVGGIPTSNSSFSGNIIVNGGKLVGAAVRTGSNTVFGAASNTRTITVNAGATLEFDAPNTFGNHNATSVPTLVINGGTVTNADPASSNAVNNALNNVTLNNGALTSTTGSAAPLDPPRASETYGAWNINGTVTSSGTSVISAGVASNTQVMLASNGSGPWNTTFNVTDGTLTVSAPMMNGDHAVPAVSGLIKSGAGIMTVSSTANTYSGTTAVNAGTLALTGSVPYTSDATVAAGATLDLARTGGASALDVVTPVTNDGLLSVSTAGQQVRAVSGIGTTSVGINASLTANSIVQDTLIIGAGGSVTIREVPTAAGGAANAVPEPGTWVLIGTALLGWLAFRRRNRR